MDDATSLGTIERQLSGAGPGTTDETLTMAVFALTQACKRLRRLASCAQSNSVKARIASSVTEIQDAAARLSAAG